MPHRPRRLSQVLLTLLCCSSNICWAQADDEHAPKIIAKFQFPSVDPVILIDTTWEGKPANFIFDTGSTTSVLDSATFSSLASAQKQMDAETPNGFKTVDLYNPPKLTIGPLRLADAGPVARSDLSAFRSHLKRPIIGILGNNVWRKFVAQIDFDHRELRFFEPDDRPHSEWGNAIALETPQGPDGPEQHNEFAMIRLRIGGFENLFMIDTGNTRSGSIPRDGFDNVSSASNCPIISVPAVTITGSSSIRMMRAPEFILGDNHYRDLLFGENATWDGALGLDFLTRHLVTIDFPHAKLYLKPGKEFARHDVFSMSGISLQESKGRQIITVIPKGQADLAGLRDGDVLLKVNGKDANSYEFSDMFKLLRSKEGTEIDILFLRDGITHSATFKLHDCL